jgi:NTE family protein
VTPVEKSWGPDYLRFGISLESNFDEDSYYTVRAAYDKTWINDLGGELLIAGEFGRKNALGVDLYQPLEASQRYFLESSLSTGAEVYGVYQNNKKLADYEKTRSIISFGGGVNVGLLGQFHVGWRQTWTDASLQTGVPGPALPSEMHASFGGGYGALDFDQMDRLYFPTRGWSSRLAYFNSPDQGYSKLNAQLEAAHSFGDYVLNAKLAYQGSPTGTLPPYDAGSLGGFGNLAGFVQNQLNGDDIRYAGIRAEKIIGRLPLGLRGDMRAGISFETGKVGTPYTETQLSGWQNSASIYLGGETPLGPVYLGYGRSDSGASSIYLFIGTP